MNRIRILCDFKDPELGPFYKDEIRKVSSEKAGFFRGNGWAVDADDVQAETAVAPDLSPKKLDVHSVRHATKARI